MNGQNFDIDFDVAQNFWSVLLGLSKEILSGNDVSVTDYYERLQEDLYFLTDSHNMSKDFSDALDVIVHATIHGIAGPINGPRALWETIEDLCTEMQSSNISSTDKYFAEIDDIVSSDAGGTKAAATLLNGLEVAAFAVIHAGR